MKQFPCVSRICQQNEAVIGFSEQTNSSMRFPTVFCQPFKNPGDTGGPGAALRFHKPRKLVISTVVMILIMKLILMIIIMMMMVTM